MLLNVQRNSLLSVVSTLFKKAHENYMGIQSMKEPHSHHTHLPVAGRLWLSIRLRVIEDSQPKRSPVKG